MDDRIRQELIETAISFRQRAYIPYSRYAVGAAVLADDGRIYGGCNVENASYGASNCAERTAIFKAVSEGVRRITAVAVIGGPGTERGAVSGEATPCGICRQVIREFADPDTCEIIIVRSAADYRTTTLAALLPDSFGPDNLA